MERITQQNQGSRLKVRIINGQWHYYIATANSLAEVSRSLFKEMLKEAA